MGKHKVTPEDKAFLATLSSDRLCAMHDEIHRIMIERGKRPQPGGDVESARD